MNGHLVSIGVHNLGLKKYEHFKCTDCGAEFPVLSKRYNVGVYCNGFLIKTCPWHGPDSKMNSRARGDFLNNF
jgi:hypothetical protein